MMAALVSLLFWGSVVLVLAWAPLPVATAGLITSQDIIPLTGHYTGSGNGTLNLILFTESAGGSGNSAGSFNGDNACTDMPTGSSKTTASESYITSIGELRQFYALNFPGLQITNIVLYVDLNQITGDPGITLNDLVVVTDYAQNFGDSRDNPHLNDITSAKQNATNAGFSGGTIQARLDGPKTLPFLQQGAGWADYAIHLGVNPQDPSFSDSTRILFHWESSGHNDGGETIFLSGTYQVPEPATLIFLASGRLLFRRRRAG
jgi:hypothetical protein